MRGDGRADAGRSGDQAVSEADFLAEAPAPPRRRGASEMRLPSLEERIDDAIALSGGTMEIAVRVPDEQAYQTAEAHRLRRRGSKLVSIEIGPMAEDLADA